MIASRERLGGAAWALAAVQLLVVHLVVQSRWSPAYSWSRSNISDLGVTDCRTWEPDGRYACSPWHAAMNVSFVLTGLLVVVGALLLGGWAGRRAQLGRGLVVLGGIGWVVVGLFPADLALTAHASGANLILLVGNVGVLLVGVSRARLHGPVPAALGVLGLVGVTMFLAGSYAGLGIGGMERVAALPLLLWCGGVGLCAAVRPTARPTS